MLIMPSFPKSLMAEQFQGNYLKSKAPSYTFLSISIIVDRNNKIRHVLGMRALIRNELRVIHNSHSINSQ